MTRELDRFQFDLISRYRKGIYGFCAIWIVLFHAKVNEGVDWSFGLTFLKPLDSFISAGHLGVDLFLVASGISLYYSFQKDDNVARFISKRLWRILPVFFLTFGVFWLFKVIAGYISFPRFIWNLMLVYRFVSSLEPGDGGPWYIAAILILYFLYPYLHAFIFGNRSVGNRGSLARTGALIIASLLFFWLMHKYAIDIFWKSEIFLGRIPSFLLGCYLGRLSYEHRSINGFCWIVCLVICGGFFTAYSAGVLTKFWGYRVFFPMAGLCFAYILAEVLRIISNVKALKVSLVAALETVSSVSLELYCTHLIVFVLRSYGFPGVCGRAWVAFVLAFIAVLWALAVSKAAKSIETWVRSCVTDRERAD